MSSRQFENRSETPTIPPPDQRYSLYGWTPGMADGPAVRKVMVFIDRILHIVLY